MNPLDALSVAVVVLADFCVSAIAGFLSARSIGRPSAMEPPRWRVADCTSLTALANPNSPPSLGEPRPRPPGSAGHDRSVRWWRERHHLTAITTAQTPTVAVDTWSKSHGIGRPMTTGPMAFAAVIIKNSR